MRTSDRVGRLARLRAPRHIFASADSPLRKARAGYMHLAPRAGSDTGIRLRAAVAADLEALIALEHQVFTTDHISRRSFRGFLRSRTAAFIAADGGEKLAGYALVLFRSGSSVARLYSIAVAPEVAGRGLGKALLAAAEEAALVRKCAFLRLEVDERNTAGVAFYRRAGYRPLMYCAQYYEDGGGAYRREKPLTAAAEA